MATSSKFHVEKTMQGASAQSAGIKGLVPAPAAGDENKVLKGDGTWGVVDALPAVTSSDNDKVLQVANSEWGVGTKKIDKEYATGFSSTWSEKTWSGLTEVYGGPIWSDGDNVYYSDGSDQYVLNKSTSTWETKTWTGLTEFYRESIWTDGEKIYYSDDSDQYVLDKSTSTWSVKNWNNPPEYFYGSQVWTDGENIYYSDSSDQYILDKSTSIWSTKTWTGFTNISGSGIWTDGENIYFSSGSSQYVLDKSTSTWSAKTWTGLTEFNRQHIWTDGNNIYFSADATQYVLDKSTSTWVIKTWTELIDFTGADVWSDGENIYSIGYNTNGDYGNYVLNKDNSPKLLLGTNGEFNPVPAESLAMSGATASTAGSLGFVPVPAAGDDEKYLKGDGTWGEVLSGAKTITVQDTISNTSGAFSGTISDNRVTADMKPVGLEVGTPATFQDQISVTCNAGSITIACANMAGSSTIKVTVLKAIDDPTAVTSTEYDILNNAKADKVSSATSGNFAALDANGNLTDSGYNAGSFSGNSKLDSVAVADEYDSTATYAVGDYCVHSGRLYQCSTAISTAEAWTAAHWTEKQVIDEIPNVSGLAPKASPVFTGSISLGRAAETTTGANSFAVGNNVEASGQYSHAEGHNTTADANKSHAEGYNTLASGEASHAEGANTSAYGNRSHAEGTATEASGYSTHASGCYNSTMQNVPSWVASTSYAVGDIVAYDTMQWRCKTANNDASFDQEKWENVSYDTVEAFVVGNGRSLSSRSNAMTLDWSGDLHIKRDMYVNANADGSGGTKVVTTNDITGKVDKNQGDTNRDKILKVNSYGYLSLVDNDSLVDVDTITWTNSGSSTSSFSYDLYNTTTHQYVHTYVAYYEIDDKSAFASDISVTHNGETISFSASVKAGKTVNVKVFICKHALYYDYAQTLKTDYDMLASISTNSQAITNISVNTQHMTDGTIISDLDNIPVGTQGRVKLASGLRPNSGASLYDYNCHGEGTARTLIVSSEYYKTIWVNYKNGSTWSGWQELIAGKSAYSWSDGTKPTLSNGSHYGTGCYYFKIGPLVFLSISAEFTSAPTNVPLFALPTGCRPIGTAEISVSGGGSYNAKAQCQINPSNGFVQVTSVDKWVIGSGFFLCA